MTRRRSTRSLILPAVWLGCAPGLVSTSLLLQFGLPAGLSVLCGMPTGIAGALLLLKRF